MKQVSDYLVGLNFFDNLNGMIGLKISLQRENRKESFPLVIPCVCPHGRLQEEVIRALACKVLTKPHQSTENHAQ